LGIPNEERLAAARKAMARQAIIFKSIPSPSQQFNLEKQKALVRNGVKSIYRNVRLYWIVIIAVAGLMPMNQLQPDVGSFVFY
jgi:hypothetical protein